MFSTVVPGVISQPAEMIARPWASSQPFWTSAAMSAASPFWMTLTGSTLPENTCFSPKQRHELGHRRDEMIDVDDIRARRDHVRHDRLRVAADMQLGQRTQAVNVVDHPFFPLPGELAIVDRPDLRAKGVADADAMRAGFDLMRDELDRAFDDDVHRAADRFGIVEQDPSRRW